MTSIEKNSSRPKVTWL